MTKMTKMTRMNKQMTKENDKKMSKTCKKKH